VDAVSHVVKHIGHKVLVVGEVPLQLGSSKGGPPEAVSSWVFQNLKRIHNNRNLHICKQLSFMGMQEHIKIML
jgi:hypothetical protein